MESFKLSLPLIACILASTANAGAAFSFDTAPGRLPKDVVPLSYDIAIVPNAKNRTLTGTESIALQFRSVSSTIVFNSLNERLSKVLFDGKPVKNFVSSDDQQLTTITLAAPAEAGPHTLSFAYTGKIETQPQGLFAQPYVGKGGTKGLLLTTQFEATDARRMFPCWDEPAFRATYRLSITVAANLATVSNMPIDSRVVHGPMATTTFQRSPKMPSYLVELSAGDLAEIAASKDGVKFGVWAVRGREKDGAVALANAQQILADYNDYFGYPYPLPKLDSIAVPGGFQGAMENWGAITYNDQTLLLTPTSTIANRQTVFSIQAHEMAHQWNGDLVTMGWWDDIWLNESFASWRAAKETDLRNPSWNWWEREDGSKEGAMAADARVTSHAIEQHITDELQATNSFDPQITYSKGQALLRMFEAYLGPDLFRDGIRNYMKARAFSNATSRDLWNALGATAGQDVAAIAAPWTEQPGFPVVAVQASCDASGARTISLSQKRFLLQGSADANAGHWSVPLQIRSKADGTPQSLLLTHDGQTAAAGRCDQPLSINAGTIGFYRSMYDDATLKVNTANFGSLPNADRIALLDDQWALVESGAQQLPSYLALASTMGSDLDTRAWDQITDALGTIEKDERGTPGYAAFASYARSIVKPAADQLGWDPKADESPGVQRLRRGLLLELSTLDDRSVIDEARKRFAAFEKDRSTIRPDEQGTILSIVARHADAATFERLHAIAKASKDEMELRRYYPSLMDVKDPELAKKAALIALSPEIPPQAEAMRMNLIARLSEEHPQLSWKTFSANVKRLTEPMASFAPIVVAQFVPEIYWDALPLDQLEAWIKTQVPAEMAPNIARGMETARFNLAQKTALVKEADAYIANSQRVDTPPLK